MLSGTFIKWSSGIIVWTFWRTFQSSSLNVGCFLFCSLLRSYTASTMLRSGLWGGQSMTDCVPLCILLSRYTFTPLILCLGSFPCWKMKLSPIRHFPGSIAWWDKSWWYFSVFTIPLQHWDTGKTGQTLKNRTLTYCSSACHFFCCS